MKLLKVILKGFKAFHDESLIGPFGSLNYLIGLNGSGKSTVLGAIQFVLLNSTSRFKDGERMEYINSEDSTAFAELIFDNSDSSFPIQEPEVSIRRVISLNRDEIFINRKLVTTQYIESLFESANFSLKASPFIIPQGQVKSIAKLSDSGRLALFRDLAGITWFESQYQSSLGALGKNKEKINRIDETLDYIQEKIYVLNEEKIELDEYHEIEKKMKALESIIYQKEIEKLNFTILTVDNDISSSSSVLSELNYRIKNVKTQIDQITIKIAENQLNTNNNLLDLNQIQTKIDDNMKILTHIQLEKDEIINKLNQEQNRFSIEEKRLQDLQNNLSLEEECYNSLQFQLEKFKNSNFEYQTLKKLEQEIQKDQNLLSDYHSNINKLNLEIKELEEKKQVTYSIYEELIQNQKSFHQKKIELLNTQKKLWREINLSENKIHSLQNSLVHIKTNAFPYGIKEGFDFVNSLHLPGVFGPLTDIFFWPSDLDLVMESAIGSKINLIITKNTDVAKNILDLLFSDAGIEKKKVHLFPLDKIVHNTPLHLENDEDVKCLADFVSIKMDCIGYNSDQQEKDFENQQLIDLKNHIFGKIGLCKNFDTAIKTAKEKGIVSVTMSGDVIYPNNLIRGGKCSTHFHFRRKYEEILSAIKVEQALIQKLNNQENMNKDELDHTIEKIQEINENISNNKSILFEINEEIRDNSSQLSKLKETFKLLEQDLKNKQSLVNQSSKSQEKINLDEFIQLKNNLIQKDFEIKKISSMITDIERNMKDFSSVRHSYELQINNISNQIDKVNFEQEILYEKVKDNKNASQFLNFNLIELQNQKDQLIDQFRDESGQIKEEKQKLETLIFKKKEYENEMEKWQQKIQTLGAISANYQEAYENKVNQRNYDHAKLFSKLEKYQEEIKKYSHVNKKAGENFDEFKNQDSLLKEKRESLIQEEQAIMDLIASEDLKKDSELTSMFEKINRAFSIIYEKLEPTQKCSLQMNESGISFNFNKSSNFSNSLDEMSGGQTTILALSLSLAIQIVLPSPFFCIDEVDADLDYRHRVLLKDLLNNLSKKQKQFFIITNHNESVNENEGNFFLFSYESNSSLCRQIEASEAQKLLIELPTRINVGLQ